MLLPAISAIRSSMVPKSSSFTDGLQDFCLGWLQFHEQSQHMQDIEQFGRILGQPVVGLNVAELGRRPAVADDRPLAVFLAVAEPPRQHALAGNFILPHRRRLIVNEALAY
jgi:hypothetical protein